MYMSDCGTRGATWRGLSMLGHLEKANSSDGNMLKSRESKVELSESGLAKAPDSGTDLTTEI